MKPESTEKAIILKAVLYQEKHQIVTAFCEHSGKVQLAAQNSIHSKRYGPSLQPLTASELRFHPKPDREVWNLIEAKPIQTFDPIRTDFEFFSLASVFIDVIQRSTQAQDSSPELFKLLSNAIVAVETAAAHPSQPQYKPITLLLCSFLAKILQWNGTQPQLLQCLQCDFTLRECIETECVHFSVPRAGWICTNCAHEHETALKEDAISLDFLTIGQFFRCLETPIRKTLLESDWNEASLKKLLMALLRLLEFHVPSFDRNEIKPLTFLLPENSLQSPVKLTEKPRLGFEQRGPSTRYTSQGDS